MLLPLSLTHCNSNSGTLFLYFSLPQPTIICGASPQQWYRRSAEIHLDEKGTKPMIEGQGAEWIIDVTR